MTRLRAIFGFTTVVLRSLARDRTALFFILVLPVVVIVIIGSTFGGQDKLSVGVVRQGTGPVSARIATELRRADGIDVQSYDDLEAVRRAVRRGAVTAGVVLPRTLDADVAAGRPARVGLVTPPASKDALTARVAVGGVLDRVGAPVGAAALVSGHGGMSFQDALHAADAAAPVSGAAVRVDDVGSGRVRGLSRFALVAPQNLVLFVFINSLASAALLVLARRNGILTRAAATPAGPTTVLLGLGAGWFAFVLVQSVLIIAVGAVLFGVRWGDPIGAAALVVVFGLVGCGAGLIVGAVGENEDRVGSVTPVIGIVLGALGGCMVPLDVFPPAMRTLAHVIPQYWAIVGWQRLIFDGDGIAGIAGPLLVLAGFAAVLLATASTLFRRRLAGT